MTTSFATVIRATAWSTDPIGVEFRVVSIDRCPNCQVEIANTIELNDKTGTGRCQICFAQVVYVGTPFIIVDGETAPKVDRIPEKDEYIGFVGAHPNNLYKVIEADAKGALIDYIGEYRAVSPDAIIFHNECDDLWCIACFTYRDDINGGWTRVRRSAKS